MLEIFDSKNIFDILYDYTERNNCAVVYFHNKALEKTEDQALIDEVFSFYEEFLPEDLYLILKRGHDNMIQFSTDDQALINATSWFPSKDLVKSDEYYWYCCVISQQGDMIYENLPPPNWNSEGA
jgi:hypothetical protein